MLNGCSSGSLIEETLGHVQEVEHRGANPPHMQAVASVSQNNESGLESYLDRA